MQLNNSIYKGIVIDVDEVNHKAKVRIPQLDGGTTSGTRVLDKDLSYMPSMIALDSSDIGKVVIVTYEGGSRTNPLILGRLWV